MAISPSPAPAGQQASFAALLTETVDGVVQAQRRLDTDALARTTQFIATPQGEIALPPLWYTFSVVNLQLELTASVTRLTSARPAQAGEDAKRGSVRLDCRLVNPAAVSLFGYTAVSGFKVSLTLAPQHASPLLAPAPDAPTYRRPNALRAETHMATPPKTPGKHGRRAADHITASLAGSSSEAAGAPLPASVTTNLRAESVITTTRLGTLARIGTDRLVTVEGVTGVFTPISTATETPIGTDERKNLFAIIDELKREIGALQSSNLKLANDLRALRERPSAPDDFATAVQQSLDEMQQRMSTMRNSMSNFAVKELKLDASVFVQVSPLGSIEYRFVQPGDDIEAAAVSRLSLDIVPVPKNDLAGVWTVNFFQPSVSISALPEITAEQTKSLETAGLFSIGEFLQVGTRARAQAYLEALLGTERTRLELWAQQAMLMTLRGVNGAAAMVLIEAGLGNFEALAGLTVEAVVKAYREMREKRSELGAPEADEALAALWIRAARQYLGLGEPEVAPVT